MDVIQSSYGIIIMENQESRPYITKEDMKVKEEEHHDSD